MIGPSTFLQTRKTALAALISLTISACGAGTDSLSSTVNSALQAANSAAESASETASANQASTDSSTDTPDTSETTPTDSSGTDESSDNGNETNTNTETTNSEPEPTDPETTDPGPAPETTDPEPETTEPEPETTDPNPAEPEPDVEEPMAAIDSGDLFDYENQLVPSYITKDNTTTNTITNAGATLGRVLFYDKSLSTDDSIACASCHQQDVGFSDSAVVSQGVNGVTGRHSMRLVNSRFSDEANFFWDERADTLEEQTTQPIRDHGEMGFSGQNGAPDFDELITKLSDTNYYPTLFTMAYGNSVVTEANMQDAMAQFLRSIQSFDSRYDAGRAQVAADNINFANFTALENEGKQLFIRPPNFNTGTGERLAGSGLGCTGCHQAPEFDIDTNSRNNGVITVAGNALDTDLTNTRSPTLRDLFSSDGSENGPFMHDGSLSNFDAVLNHYNDITNNPVVNPTLDNRLIVGGGGGGGPNNGPGQKLQLTLNERAAVTAFVKTLSGSNLYTDPKWSDPFLPDGSLSLTP